MPREIGLAGFSTCGRRRVDDDGSSRTHWTGRDDMDRSGIVNRFLVTKADGTIVHQDAENAADVKREYPGAKNIVDQGEMPEREIQELPPAPPIEESDPAD